MAAVTTAFVALAADKISSSQTVLPKILRMRASLAVMTTTGFGYGSRLRHLDRAIYTTITVMSVLMVYDGWQSLKFGAAVGVILGPMFAMFVSHVFSASLARQTELHRRPGGSETMRIIRTESRFLLLAAPALALLIILTVAGVSLSRSIQAVIFLEGASLGFWASWQAAGRAALTAAELRLRRSRGPRRPAYSHVARPPRSSAAPTPSTPTRSLCDLAAHCARQP